MDRAAKDRARQYRFECADCGIPTTSRRCRKCSHKARGHGAHGRSKYTRDGCRCDTCVAGHLAYTKTATCFDCGAPCQPSKPKAGWSPPTETRCQSCYLDLNRRPEKSFICQCGNPKHHSAKTCKACRSSMARSPRESARYRDARLRRSRAPGLRRSAIDRLAKKWKKQGRACSYCHAAPMEVIDHVLPLALGGTSFEGNLTPACWSCNSKKSDLLLSVWRYGSSLRLTRTPIPPPRVRPVAKPVVKSEPVEVMVSCQICGAWVDLPSVACSDLCKVELNARRARDRYRAKVGLPVDPCKPTFRRPKVVVGQ